MAKSLSSSETAVLREGMAERHPKQGQASSIFACYLLTSYKFVGIPLKWQAGASSALAMVP